MLFAVATRLCAPLHWLPRVVRQKVLTRPPGRPFHRDKLRRVLHAVPRERGLPLLHFVRRGKSFEQGRMQLQPPTKKRHPRVCGFRVPMVRRASQSFTACSSSPRLKMTQVSRRCVRVPRGAPKGGAAAR